jgi:hypothetical protein
MAVTTDLSAPEGRYFMMLLIRAVEETINRLFNEGLVHGTAHLCIGQEACAVGAVAAARANDPIVSSHRGHGHFLARTGDPALLMAELLGRSTGPCAGRGGSQHLCSRSDYFYGTNGITGGGLPVASGLALSARLQSTGQVVLCFFGDGATNQGTFHESLNMAAIWQLPILYVCENNRFAMSTRVEDSMKVAIADRALREVADNVDIVMVTSDDLGMIDRPLVSPALYRSLVKPRQRRTFDFFRARTSAKLYCHTDGAVYPLIPDLIEIGVDALNPIEVSAVGMGDTGKLKREFGQTLTFWGAIDTRRVLPFGTTEEVREEVRRRIHDLAPGGGYVVSPVHNIQPDVPPENVVAMYDAAYELGRYPLTA